MKLKNYNSSYHEALLGLFYNTLKNVNIKDYSKEQILAWAKALNVQEFDIKLKQNHTLIACKDREILGFASMKIQDDFALLEYLFISHKHQRQGIASLLCENVESKIKTPIITYASLSAKGFFEKRGYMCLKENKVQRSGIELVNFTM